MTGWEDWDWEYVRELREQRAREIWDDPNYDGQGKTMWRESSDSATALGIVMLLCLAVIVAGVLGALLAYWWVWWA